MLIVEIIDDTDQKKLSKTDLESQTLVINTYILCFLCVGAYKAYC